MYNNQEHIRTSQSTKYVIRTQEIQHRYYGFSVTVIQFSNRILQLAATLKSLNLEISDSGIAAALLNSQPEELNHL